MDGWTSVPLGEFACTDKPRQCIELVCVVVSSGSRVANSSCVSLRVDHGRSCIGAAMLKDLFRPALAGEQSASNLITAHVHGDAASWPCCSGQLAGTH